MELIIIIIIICICYTAKWILLPMFCMLCYVIYLNVFAFK
jgi:hypothetical protein